jgi:putative oxidoreductase
MAESIGALMLIFGLGGRLAAFGIGVTMVVAGMMHVKNGFFMNWFGQQAGEGYEYHLLTIGLAIVTMIAGSGALSVDRLLARTESE